MIRIPAAAVLVLSALSLQSAPAEAGRNDINLLTFGTCSVSDRSPCTNVRTDEDGFASLARELALVMTPLSPTAADTLGIAGYSISVVQGFHGVDTSERHWSAAEDPTSSLQTTHLVVRKGLPLSIDIGTHFGTLWNSSLMSVGADLRWSIHENFLWPAPDLTVRGFATTVVNHPQMNLTTAGAEVVTGVPFGVGHVVNLTPYAGYSYTAIIPNTRVIDADPANNRPIGGIQGEPDSAYNSEFNLDPGTDFVHRGLFGLRVQFAVVELSWQASVSSVMFQNALLLGARF